mgnify:FL=1
MDFLVIISLLMSLMYSIKGIYIPYAIFNAWKRVLFFCLSSIGLKTWLESKVSSYTLIRDSIFLRLILSFKVRERKNRSWIIPDLFSCAFTIESYGFQMAKEKVGSSSPSYFNILIFVNIWNLFLINFNVR